MAANANIGAARAAFYPSISLTASFGNASGDLSNLFGAGSSAWTFVPQLITPIFNAGKNDANLRSAEVAMRIEIVNYEKAIQTAFREVADALISRQTYSQEIEEQAAAIVAQTRRLQIANLRYKAGEDAYLNVLSAQQSLYSAQQGLLQARFNKIASQIALYKALGGGWEEK